MIVTRRHFFKICGGTLVTMALADRGISQVVPDDMAGTPGMTDPTGSLGNIKSFRNYVAALPNVISKRPDYQLTRRPDLILVGLKARSTLGRAAPPTVTKEEVEDRLKNTGLMLQSPLQLEPSPRLGGRSQTKSVLPPKKVNHTANRYWIRSVSGNPIDQPMMNTVEAAFPNMLNWIGGVYQLPGATGSKGLVCPLPKVLLIKPVPGVTDEKLAPRLARFHLKHVPKISKYLAGYRYYVLEDAPATNVYKLPGKILKEESAFVQQANFDFMPLFVPHADPCNPNCNGSNPTGLSDPGYLDCSQWNMLNIRAGGPTGSAGWEISMGDSSVLVAIIDAEGCQVDHPDLREGYVPGATLDFDAADPTRHTDIQIDTQRAGRADSDNHGTRCAGIIAARYNQEGLAGLAGNCRFLPIRPISYSEASVCVAIIYAAEQGARVISMSFGGDATTGDYLNVNEVLDQGIQSVYETQAVTLCASTMNNNQRLIYHPAAHPSVLGCGASNCDERRCDENDWGPYSGSNYGDQLFVVAPGNNIPTTDVGSGYVGNFNGTSAAAPHVAGLAALILSVNPNLLNQQVRCIIEETADKVNPDTYNYSGGPRRVGWNEQMGYGRINVRRALEEANSHFYRDNAPPSAPSGLSITS